MSTAQFENNLNSMIFRAEERVMEAYRMELKESFGFGEKRMTKLLCGIMKRLEV